MQTVMKEFSETEEPEEALADTCWHKHALQLTADTPLGRGVIMFLQKIKV